MSEERPGERGILAAQRHFPFFLEVIEKGRRGRLGIFRRDRPTPLERRIEALKMYADFLGKEVDGLPGWVVEMSTEDLERGLGVFEPREEGDP